MADPDVIRGAGRVTGEKYDPETGGWIKPPEPPVTEAHAQPATASGGQPPGNED